MSPVSSVNHGQVLKRICPGLDAKTLTISTATGKGRHSTSFASLIDIGGGYVADLPGLRAIGFSNLEEETVRSEFWDIEEVALGCRFSDCTHTSEPGCAVLAAVEEGSVAGTRHAEFLKVMRDAKRSRGHGCREGRRPVAEHRTRAARWWEAEDNS